jgi:lysophospholipase
MSLVETERDPAPKGAQVDWLTASDGTRLRTVRWVPAGASRGTVFVANGRTEFVEKYFEFVADLLARGYAVATHDWRGQGLSGRLLSDRLKGHVGVFDDYVSDFDQVVREVLRPHCPAPYRVISHSMGGNITLRLLERHRDAFESAIFSAPMWGLGQALRVPRVARFTSAVAARLGLGEVQVPGKSESAFEGNVLTSDRTRFDRFAAQAEREPKLLLGSPTFGWVHESIGSIDRIHSAGFCEGIDVPIHVCTAGADTLVSCQAQAAVIERLPEAVQTVIEGSRHEIIMEADGYRDRFLEIVDDFWLG